MIPVPDSVLAYHTNKDVEAAVDLLLDAEEGRNKARGLSKMDWPDVASYYKACLAAQQTRVEFAIFLEELWNATWGTCPSNWRNKGAPATPADPIRPLPSPTFGMKAHSAVNLQEMVGRSNSTPV